MNPTELPTTDPPRRGRDLWVGLLLLLSLGATAPYFGRLMNANERPRVLQAIAWVDAAELAIDGPAARGIAAGVDVARSPVDGRLYPNKPPGATIPAVVAYAGLRAVDALGGPTPTLRSVTIASRVLGGLLPGFVILLLIVRRLRTRGAGPAAEAAVLLIALATPFTAYCRLLFGHCLAGCLLVAGMFLLFDATGRERASWRVALAGGALAAAAISVEYVAAFAGLPLAALLYVRWRQGTPRPVLVAAVAGALLPTAALAGYHAQVFGSPWATGYHHVVDAGFAEIHGRGALGLGLPTGQSIFEHLLSPWGGLLVWAPVVAVSLGVALWQWRALDLEERVATGTLLLITVVVVSLAQTGGWRVGPRYLVLAMPLSAYGLVRLVHALGRRRVWATAVLGLALASTVLDALAANLFPHLIPHGNPWADVLLPLATEARTPYSLLPPGVWTLLFTVGLPLALVLWATLRCIVPTEPETTRRARVGTTAGLACLLALGLLVAALQPAEHPEAAGDLQAIRSIWEPDGPRPAPVTVLAPLPE